MSETDFGFDQYSSTFKPNYFVDISSYLHQKLDTLSIYSSELAEHPFPRSLKSVTALATLRGAQRGSEYAEAFEMLREFLTNLNDCWIFP